MSTKATSSIWISRRQASYLTAIEDWASPQAVAAKMGFQDKRAAGAVSRCFSIMAQRGLAELRREPYEYRITEQGRALLFRHAYPFERQPQ